MKTSIAVLRSLLICCVCVSSSVAATLSDSVAWYKLDYAASGDLAGAGEVIDAQANPINGTGLLGIPSWTSTGVPGDGRALRFEGQEEAIGVVEHVNTKLSFINDLTLFARVKVSGIGGHILNRTKTSGSAGKSWYLYRSGRVFTMSIYEGGTTERYTALTLDAAYQDTWVNVFGVFNPGNSVSIFLYGLDGNLIASNVNTTNIPMTFGYTEAHMAIGGMFWSTYATPGTGYDGEIESVAIWNGVLSEADMQNIAFWEGTLCTEYNVADLNKDCYVNIEDFAMFALSWLMCYDPENVNCQ